MTLGNRICALTADGPDAGTHPGWSSAAVGELQLLADLMAIAIQHAEQTRELTGLRVETELAGRAARLSDDLDADDFEDIVGDSPALRVALSRVLEVASTDASVVLLGETGTGKELFARAVHDRSSRRGQPFVRVNCAALPPTLIESELFGHERGAFTGAVSMRQGRFELAHRGTIFLDEIGDLAADIQAKLLRVLQEGEFERVGSSQTRKVDVRVVAATHRDLDAAVREGRFRVDLFYRLNVFPIVLPPLRERIEDIPRLAWFFINRRQRALNRRFTRIPAAVMTALQEHAWPGNVRELENVIERAMIHSTGRHARARRRARAEGVELAARGRHAGGRRAAAHRTCAAPLRLADQRQRQRRRSARPASEHAAVPDEEARDPKAGRCGARQGLQAPARVMAMASSLAVSGSRPDVIGGAVPDA